MNYNYPYLRIEVVQAFVPAAVREGASQVALDPVRGFTAAYEVACGCPELLGREPLTGIPWDDFRSKKLTAWMTQTRRMQQSLWTPSGHPTRRHLNYIMWAYSPTPHKLLRYYNEVICGSSRRKHARV